MLHAIFRAKRVHRATLTAAIHAGRMITVPLMIHFVPVETGILKMGYKLVLDAITIVKIAKVQKLIIA